MKTPQITLAEAIRVEHNLENGDIFLVFKIIDPQLKKEIIRDWTQNIELKLVGRALIKYE